MTEEEMNRIRDMFAKGADAIVSASSLRNEVEELKKTMSDVKQNADETHQTNQALLRQLSRQDAEITQLKTELDTLKVESSQYNQRLAQKDEEIHHLYADQSAKGETIQRLQRESDDHLNRALKAEETLDNVKGKLSDIQTAVQSVAKVYDEVESFLHPAPSEPQEPLPEGVQVYSLDTTPPEVIHNAIADAVGEPEAKLPEAREEAKPEEPELMPWQRYGFGGGAS